MSQSVTGSTPLHSCRFSVLDAAAPASDLTFQINLRHKHNHLTCPKCFGAMRVISFIEDEEVIKKILKHLDLWDLKARPPPKRAKAPPPTAHIDYSDSQVPPCEDYLNCDPDYPIETYAS